MEIIDGLTVTDTSVVLTGIGIAVHMIITICLNITALKLLNDYRIVSIAVYLLMVSWFAGILVATPDVPILTEKHYYVIADDSITVGDLTNNYEIVGYENGKFILRQLASENETDVMVC